MGFKAQKQDKFYLSIYLDTRCETIRDPDPEDPWDRGDAEVTLLRVTAKKVKSQEGWIEEDVPDVGTKVYVLIEVYDTGDTFGQDLRYHETKSWHRTYEEAARTRDNTPVTDGYFNRHVDWLIEPVIIDSYVQP